MKTIIKKINQDTDLVYAEDQLHIMQGDNKLISGFSYMGTVINNLIPLHWKYKDRNVFKYYDLETNTEYRIDDVDWISGFHYQGNDLNTMYHNFRTDPLTNLVNNEYVFNTQDPHLVHSLKELNGYSSRKKIKTKYDPETDTFIEFNSDEVEHVLTDQLFTELMNSIKYLRIVGVGKLGFSNDFTSKPVKHNGQVVFNNKQLTLDGVYGVVDVRTGNTIIERGYEYINILPWSIRCSTDKIVYYTMESKHYSLKQ